MKKILFFTMLFFAAFTATAQTITWTGAGVNSNWNTTANWNLGVVPTSTNDVIIPTGKTVTINVSAFTKSIQVQGNSTVTIAESLSFLNASAFASATTINWSSGQLVGGGTLTNSGTINLTTTAIKYISALTTLTNVGTINMTDSGDLYISNGTVNNQPTGVIDLRADSGNLSYNSGGIHALNNSGLIKRTATTGNVIIECDLNNTGTITVQTGIMTLAAPAIILNGGIYNTNANATLRFTSTVNINGTMTGVLNGQLNWAGIVNVAASNSATFNFTGSSGIVWSDGSLSGGGTLINQSMINCTTTAIKYLVDASILNNQNIIKITDSGDLYISNGTLNNTVSGTIDLQADSGNLSYNSGGTHLLNNAGLIKKTTSTGITIIECVLQNTGTIAVQSGTLTLQNDSITLTNGTYNVTAGNNFIWSNTVTVSGILNGTLAGQINWVGTVNVPVAATLNFNGIGINWSSGAVSGVGILTHQGEMSLSTTAIKYLQGGVTFINVGNMKITDSGDLYISNGTLNNQTAGVIDLQSDSGNLSYNSAGNHTLNNAGTIKKTNSTGIVIVDCALQNTGTISVMTGILVLSSPTITLTGGTYNVLAGKTLRLSSTVTASGTLTGLIDGEINWTETVRVLGTANFNFTGAGMVNWSSGTLLGGGVLNSNFKMNLTTTAIKFIQDLTTMNNSTIVNMTDSGDLYISNGTFNNLASGTIDLRADSGNLSYNSGGIHILNNAGLIKKTTTNGTVIIECVLKNTGTIAVENGILFLGNPEITLTNGIYNVTSSAVLRFGSTVTLAGTLTGTLNGEMNWIETINVPIAATLNFTGTNVINWSSGSINGGGILIQKGNMNLSSTAIKFIYETSTLNNEGTINMIDTGDLYISNGTLNNLSTGIIDLKVDSGDISYNSAGFHILNNAGTIKKSNGSGVANIYPTTTNTGILDCAAGTLNLPGDFMFTNTATGTIKGIATIDLPPAANYVNQGIFAPGGSPGKLTVIGDYKSTPTSKLSVEINGLNQVTQYDLLAIQGAAVMNGTVEISLGFDAIVGSTFTIATTTGLITSQLLSASPTAIFNGYLYTFNITYPANNKVVLTVAQRTLGIENHTLAEKNLLLSPNPASDFIVLRNTSGLNLSEASIIDFSGRTIKKIDLNTMQDDVTISLENIASGSYLIRVNSGETIVTKKFIKH